MKKSFKIFFVVILFINSNLFAQTTNKIFGRVFDEKGKPMEYVDVYISGTMFGTSTTSNGKFSISNIPPGNHELVISLIGFDLITKSIKIQNDTNLKLEFNLKEKPYELNTVEVKGEKPEGWDDNLTFFKLLFIGRGKYSNKCEILNPEVIGFNVVDGKTFSAYNDAPIKIKNDGLGFNINCEIVSFTYNNAFQNLKYIIKTKFSEIDTSDIELKNEWIKNRESIYKGSLNHFLNSLLENNFSEEGYTIVQDEIPTDKIFYHGREYINNSKEILENGIVQDEKVLSYFGYLGVVYNDQTTDSSKVSWIKLNNDDVTIDKYGYPLETIPFNTTGYWSILGIADMLPKYYFTNNL